MDDIANVVVEARQDARRGGPWVTFLCILVVRVRTDTTDEHMGGREGEG